MTGFDPTIQAIISEISESIAEETHTVDIPLVSVKVNAKSIEEEMIRNCQQYQNYCTLLIDGTGNCSSENRKFSLQNLI